MITFKHYFSAILILCCLSTEGQEKIAITKNNYNDQPPLINDKYMVWRTDENGNFNILAYDFEKDSSFCVANSNNNIFLSLSDQYIVWNAQSDTDDEIAIYNLRLGVAYLLTNNLSDDIHPTLSNRYAAWENNNGFESNIVLYDLEKGKTAHITNYRNNVMPQLDDNYLVWQVKADDKSNSDELYLYEISTKKMTNIATHHQIHNTKIKNGYIAWTATDKNKAALYLYDISNKKRLQITDHILTDSYFELSPPYLVFNENDGDDEVALFQIGDTKPILLTNNNTDDLFPVVNGCCVAWSGYINYGIEEFLYDINTQKTRQMTHSGGFNLHVALNSEYMVWCTLDFDDMDTDIFMCQIPDHATSPNNVYNPKK